MTIRFGRHSVPVKDDVSCLGMPAEHADFGLTVRFRWSPALVPYARLPAWR